MSTYLLTLAYDGTDYHGWQRQKGVRTLQESVESALSDLMGAPVSVTASGRTDEGVHAAGQTASFCCDTRIPCEKIAAALNARLPRDIRVQKCVPVPDGFCARRSAKQKTYVYRMYVSDVPLPHCERYALRIEKAPDKALWQQACKQIEGTHDFAAFYCLGSSAKTTVRTVYACDLLSFPAQGAEPPRWELRICGNGFLYKMVRLIAGAMLRLSDGKIAWQDFTAALNGQTGRVPKIPAPAHGLTLWQVAYDTLDHTP